MLFSELKRRGGSDGSICKSISVSKSMHLLEKLEVSVLCRIATRTGSQIIAKADIEELSKGLPNQGAMRRLKFMIIFDYPANVVS